jgi:MoxR-like ATPase
VGASEKLLLGASKVIQGKPEFLELLTAALLAGGHVLIEDAPGLGKTTAAKTFARLIAGPDGAALAFKRIQFTPDLLPYDITGVDIWDPENRTFKFMPGPVLSNIVLADEINRAAPKVQSALLEAMAEGQVTIGGNSYRPPKPFFVIATENPIESEGTFPLPAAQLDRFMMRLSLGYPDRETELRLLDSNPAESALPALEPVLGADEFLAEQAAAGAVFCHAGIKAAIAGIVRATREQPAFSLGASPRAGIQLLAACRALARIRGRDFASPADLFDAAIPVLAHRLSGSGDKRPDIQHHGGTAGGNIELALKEIVVRELKELER